MGLKNFGSAKDNIGMGVIKEKTPKNGNASPAKQAYNEHPGRPPRSLRQHNGKV